MKFTEDIVLTRLGEAARPYLTSTLEEGKSLSRALAETIDFAKGEVFSFLPRGYVWTESLLWRESLQIAPDASRRMLATTLVRLAADSSKPLCIFEHQLASKGDRWLATAESIVRYHRTEVYHIAREITVDDVLLAASEAQSAINLNGALTVDGPRREDELPATELIDADILAMAASATAVVVSAFDGESYVVWSAKAIHAE